MSDSAHDLPVAKPVTKNPTVTRAQPTGRMFPCPQCGARLDFDPAAGALACPYCGHKEAVTRDASGEVVERDYLHSLDADKAFRARGLIDGRSTQTRCPGCGAMVLLEDKVQTDKCPFCVTHLESTPESAADAVPPESLLPFAVALRSARESFSKWLHSLWFAPSELTKMANLGQLTGVYLPYWTYDTMTYSAYHGERGDDYRETEYYTETLADGRTEQRSRTVTRTRWHAVEGEVQHFFDDVLVCGSTSLPVDLIGQLEPWELAQLEPFQAPFLSGFKTERYAVGLKDGFSIAKELMEPTIYGEIRRDIGGDHQRVSNKTTRYSAITFKHCLLPVWVAAYRYHDTAFQVLVNGTTGKVVGKRPWSTWKIARLVILILILLFGVIAAVVAFSGGGNRGARADHLFGAEGTATCRVSVPTSPYLADCYKAADAALGLKLDTLQVFTGSPSQWAGKPVTDTDVAAFRIAVEQAGLGEVTAHDSYLINLASPADELFERSVAKFADELDRAERLGIRYLVTHPGAHVGSGEEAGLARIVTGLDAALRKCPASSVAVLLETTAGQGSTIGHRFEHLAAILTQVERHDRFAVCFDTCHVFAAGYPLHTPDGYVETFAAFDRLIGLDRIRVFHVNDSVKGLGSRVDRHAGIGLGQIGDDSFRRLVTDPRFADRAMILETPKQDADGRAMDPVNLDKLRQWATGPVVTATTPRKRPPRLNPRRSSVDD